MSDFRPFERRIGGRARSDDFAQRLERLREASGLSWSGLARAIGVSLRAVHRWRIGAIPNGAHVLALLDFAVDRGLLVCLLRPPAGPDSAQQLSPTEDE